MKPKEAGQFCLTLPDTKQAETNDGKWTVFMKNENVFMLIRHNSVFESITIKLPVARCEELQEQYNIVSDSILNIEGWQDVDLGYEFPSSIVESWIKESYELISNEQKAAEQEKYLSLSKMLGVG